jgi:hypothetical protein
MDAHLYRLAIYLVHKTELSVLLLRCLWVACSTSTQTHQPLHTKQTHTTLVNTYRVYPNHSLELASQHPPQCVRAIPRYAQHPAIDEYALTWRRISPGVGQGEVLWQGVERRFYEAGMQLEILVVYPSFSGAPCEVQYADVTWAG